MNSTARRIARRLRLKAMAASGRRDDDYLLEVLALWSLDFNNDVLDHTPIYDAAVDRFIADQAAECAEMYRAVWKRYKTDLELEPRDFEGHFKEMKAIHKQVHDHGKPDDIPWGDDDLMRLFHELTVTFDKRVHTVGSMTLDEHLELSGWYSLGLQRSQGFFSQYHIAAPAV